MPPAEALFGRPVRGRLPEARHGPVPNQEKQIHSKLQMARQHDMRRGVGYLPELGAGDRVILQDKYSSPDKEWSVIKQDGRQVIVSDGVRTVFRNRQHVKTVRPSAVMTPVSDPGGDRLPDQQNHGVKSQEDGGHEKARMDDDGLSQSPELSVPVGSSISSTQQGDDTPGKPGNELRRSEHQTQPVRQPYDEYLKS